MPDTPSSPVVFVIVITYNGRRFLEPCFRSISNASDVHPKLLLVDNASTDSSGEWLKEAFPQVEVLRLHSNVRYVGAANASVRHALAQNADYVVVCNDDIQFLDHRWLWEAVAVAEADARVGMVGFKEVVSCDERNACMVSAIERPLLKGCALFIRTALLANVGLFDEEYQVFEEEIDLQVRTRMAGYRLVQLSVPVLHHGGGTIVRGSGRTSYWQMRSALRFALKTRGLLRCLCRLVRIVDVACSPRPISFNSSDPAHCRMRNTGSLLLNWLSLFRACAWNVVVLPTTIKSRQRDWARIAVARRALSDELQRRNAPADDGTEQDAPKSHESVTIQEQA